MSNTNVRFSARVGAVLIIWAVWGIIGGLIFELLHWRLAVLWAGAAFVLGVVHLCMVWDDR